MLGNISSQKLHALLSGQTPWEEADPSIQSWGRLFVYQAAVKVCRAGSIDDRREALASMPEFIRGRVSEEVKRIWPILPRE